MGGRRKEDEKGQGGRERGRKGETSTGLRERERAQRDLDIAFLR